MTNITMSELESQVGELLPEKETLYWKANVANISATNLALALNGGGGGSAAYAAALQYISVNQS